jgi:GABA permease
VIYLAIGVSQVRTRRAREAAGAPSAALPMWLFPWLSYVAIAGMALVLIAMALTPSHRAEFWTSIISIATALLAFVIFRRQAAPAVLEERAASKAASTPDRKTRAQLRSGERNSASTDR